MAAKLRQVKCISNCNRILYMCHLFKIIKYDLLFKVERKNYPNQNAKNRSSFLYFLFTIE